MEIDTVTQILRAAGCVYAEDEAKVLMSAADTSEDLATMVAKRAAGLPLEHAIGFVDFCGLRISWDAGVFVPRRRTEFRGSHAVALALPNSIVVDLCCGCGAVGAALAAAVAGIELHSVDIDSAAVRCAAKNVPRVYEGDLY